MTGYGSQAWGQDWGQSLIGGLSTTEHDEEIPSGVRYAACGRRRAPRSLYSKFVNIHFCS